MDLASDREQAQRLLLALAPAERLGAVAGASKARNTPSSAVKVRDSKTVREGAGRLGAARRVDVTVALKRVDEHMLAEWSENRNVGLTQRLLPWGTMRWFGECEGVLATMEDRRLLACGGA